MKTSAIILGISVIIIMCIGVINATNLSQVGEEKLNNKKINWGIKRAKDHKQPDLGAKNKELIEKYNGIAMGNSKDKYVYLTFDEGYEAGYTKDILKTLKDNNVKACFFITAHYLNTEPELVKQMIEEGHTIGNHTVNHKSLPTLSNEQVQEEIKKLHTALYEKTGYEMKYIRPPKGEFSQRTLAITKSLGYTTVMWSFAYEDWIEEKQGREEYAKAKILENIHPGSVILLHGNSKDNKNILDHCIKQIKNMGYEFKTLDEFVK
jgi:peptidoglycan-N-acetylmuramic acid deacetylase